MIPAATRLPSSTAPCPAWLDKRLVRCGLAESSSDARRKITQGGVRINGAKVSMTSAVPEADYLLQAGKLAAVQVKRGRS